MLLGGQESEASCDQEGERLSALERALRWGARGEGWRARELASPSWRALPGLGEDTRRGARERTGEEGAVRRGEKEKEYIIISPAGLPGPAGLEGSPSRL